MNKSILSALAAALLSAAMPAHAGPAGGWSDCGIGYAEHLSSKSDAGGDTKTGIVSCTRVTASGVRQTFELGAQADTPPAGRLHLVPGATVSGLPSNQRDTFETFAGYGQEWNRTPSSALAFNIRAGFINGMSTSLVRGFIDDTHRWLGVDDSRHSPLSSAGRPLLQVSGLHTSALLQMGSGWRAQLSDVESVTVGTALDALTLGLQASIQQGGATPVLPSGLPGMPLRVPTGTGVYAGVFGQSTAYDLASEDAGTVRASAYLKAGANVQLGRHVSLGLEFTHPLSHRVRAQYRASYNYLEVSAGYRF